MITASSVFGWIVFTLCTIGIIIATAEMVKYGINLPEDDE